MMIMIMILEFHEEEKDFLLMIYLSHLYKKSKSS